MTTGVEHPVENVSWQPQPKAQRLVRALLDRFMERCPAARELAERMRRETGTRFADWLDHLAVPDMPNLRHDLQEIGYSLVPDDAAPLCYRNLSGVFPSFLITDASGPIRAAIKVESVTDFAVANDIPSEPCSPALSPFRSLLISSTPDAELLAVERHGYRGFGRPQLPPEQRVRLAEYADRFRRRRRQFDDDIDGFEHAEALIDSAAAALGPDHAADIFFAAEREFWQRRNKAAQVQKSRQDRLGLGWANHDHHTYRCSRRFFARLIGIWESLGFVCRERFYAGREAGWGAQVCEHAATGVITFNDVDLSPDEVLSDFAHEPLPERHELGTVGLWCALHGESFLQAGMHHLECQFDFDSLREQLQRDGITTMKPFTDLPHLRQAFTEGQRWPVAEGRIAALLSRGQITEAQARQFREQGAIGSHLENLQRNDGYKGFNQKGISEIITATDPRKHI